MSFFGVRDAISQVKRTGRRMLGKFTATTEKIFEFNLKIFNIKLRIINFGFRILNFKF